MPLKQTEQAQQTAFQQNLNHLVEKTVFVEKKARAWAKANLLKMDLTPERTIPFWDETLPFLPVSPDETYLWAGVFYEHWQRRPKNQGVYYTPRALARYVTHKTLQPILKRFHDQFSVLLMQADTSALLKWLEVVQTFKILDPAEGCGIFLSEAMFCLNTFYQDIAQMVASHQKKKTSFIEIVRARLPRHPAHFILEHHLQGVELDEVACFITEWCLKKQAEHLDSCSVAVDLKLRCGNSLDETLPLEACDFDVILMNPPYAVEVRENAELFQWIRTQSRIRDVYQAKMDLADGFILLAERLLKSSGKLGAVLPAYWLNRSQASEIRQRFMTAMQPLEMGVFDEQVWFSRAKGHHTSVLISQKNLEENQNRVACQPQVIPIDLTDVGLGEPQLGQILYFPETFHINMGEQKAIQILEMIHRFQEPLLQSEWVQQGVVLPQGRIKIDNSQNQNNPKEVGLFLLNSSEITAMNLNALEKTFLKPYYLPKQFHQNTGFQDHSPAYWLIYADQPFIQQIEALPNLKRHLETYAHWNTSAHKPYGLHRARQQNWFEGHSTVGISGDRIYGLRQTLKPCFAVVSQPAYVNEGFYCIQLPENVDSGLSLKQFELKQIKTLLNSRLFYFWAHHQKRKGQRLQLDKDVLCRFPGSPEWKETPLNETQCQFEEIEKAYHLSTSQQHWLAQWYHKQH